ncbi:hypothetical protein D9M72_504510 [compost metagenome]
MRVVWQIRRIEGDADMRVADRIADVDAVRFGRVCAYAGQLPHDDATVSSHPRQVENRAARHRLSRSAATFLAADLDDDCRLVEQMDVLVSARLLAIAETDERMQSLALPFFR